MKKLVTLASVALVGLSVAACNTPSERAAGGAILGGATGAAIGGLATGRAGGAVVGGLIGAAAGGVLGAATAACPDGYLLVRDRYGRDVCAPRY
ncbi:hypothetical protein [Terrarubrum flagellatum]|uniref:hypothetical protein n=1 Tax=Terrirubrum flagellatum TaxID=2895980 RepID=UPI0031450E32